LPNWDSRTGNLLSGRCPDPSNSPQIAGSPAGITANLDSSASFRKSYAAIANAAKQNSDAPKDSLPAVLRFATHCPEAQRSR
jgi:hypothetical protein